jgi:hypothetical protein
LVALHAGTTSLSDMLAQVAGDCPRRGAIGNETCGAYFPDLIERPANQSPADTIRRDMSEELTDLPKAVSSI